jgi:hypothetical protein
MRARAVFLCFLLFAFSFNVCAQTRSLGAVRGRVADSSDAVVEGAEVKIANEATGYSTAVTTDARGEYLVQGLPLTGAYTIQVNKQGFGEAKREHVQLQAGTAAVAEFRLHPSAASEAIEVSGTPDSVNTTDNTLETRLDLEKIDDTPVFGRKVTTLPLLDSSVRPARGTGDLFLNNTLFVINGTGRRQTSYSVDNATADDSWGRQTMFTTLPFSSIQEFTVLTNAASAEYGRSTGSAVNVVTRSGTNNFHGDALGMFRPGDFQARVPLATVDSTDSAVQGSATIGGPIIRDRAFFTLSYEHTDQDRDSVITSPLAPGTVYTGTFDQHLFLGRGDFRLTDNHLLTARINLDSFEDTNPADAVGALALPSAGRVFSRKTYSAQLSEDWAISPHTVNEARVQWQIGSPITRFEPITPSTQFTRAGVATEGESRVGNLSNHQYQFADTLSMARGRHSLKGGADVIYSSSGGFGQEFGGGFTLGQFQVTPSVLKPVAQLTLADVTRYQQSFGNLSYNVKETLGAVFLQDNWTIRPTLTLNLGVRYEAQSLTDDHNNIAPRLGFAWQPRGAGPVFRGGYGIYYSELRANIAAGFKINGPEGIFTYSASKGAIGFPTSLAPLPAFPAGAVLPPRDITVNIGQRAYLSQFFDVSKLRFYPDALLNPYTQQWNFGIQHEFIKNTVVSLDYLGQRALKFDRPVDLNAPAPLVRTVPGQCRRMTAGACNLSGSAADADATRPIIPVNNGYKRIVALVNAGAASYNGLKVNVNTRGRRWNGLFSYTWSHTLNTTEVDVPQQDPNDSNFLGNAEKANSLLDQRHRASLSGSYQFPWQITFGSWFIAASGRPYNITTGVDNNGDASNSDRPVINGVVIPRNSGKGTPVYDISAFIEKGIRVTERFNLQLRAEGFNLANRNNIVGRNGTYGNNANGQPANPKTFGAPIGGINGTDPGREFQFMARLRF